MSRAIVNHQFHSFPRLGNMLMIKLFKIHNIVPKEDDLSGRKIVRDKCIFAFILRINTIFRQRRKPNFSTISKWNENNFNLKISLSASFFFCISHKSTKLFRWVVASSLGRRENKSFMTRFSKAVLISQDSASVRGAIEVLIKSLLLVLAKSHNLVLS